MRRETTDERQQAAGTRHIKKIAVLGSGVMGSRIACHFANIGVEVLLLDIVPNELTKQETAKGLTLDSKAVRNRIVNQSLENAIKTNPSPVFSKRSTKRITTGNFDDDFAAIASAARSSALVKRNTPLGAFPTAVLYPAIIYASILLVS